MTLWTEANIKDLVCLAEGDTVVFPSSEDVYEVCSDYVRYTGPSHGNREAIRRHLGLGTVDRETPEFLEFTLKCYGYPCAQGGEGSWPFFKLHDYEAVTRMVKVMFGIDAFASEEDRQRWLREQTERLLREKEAKEILEAQAKAKREQAIKEKEARLALLSDKGKAIMKLLNDGRPFGCRTPYIRQLVGLIIGEELPVTDGDEA
jgi:hypothetical protein